MDFLIGGLSAMAAGIFSNPFDVIKTRQQLQGELQQQNLNNRQPYSGLWKSVKSIIKAEGILGLQKGLGPALSFQFVMNSTRLGLYQTVDNLKWTKIEINNNNSNGNGNGSGSSSSKKNNGNNGNGGNDVQNSLILCLFWGGLSGVCGSFVGCPFYLIKTQIQSQSRGKYAVGFQHEHHNTFYGLKNIHNEQGIKGLWRGVSAMVPRTAVGSSVQLTTFTLCKDTLNEIEIFKNSTFLISATASMVSGFFTVVFLTPFDVVATRLFNQGIDQYGRGLLYKNVFDCFIKTFQIEGIKGLYKGFVPNYWRTAPHTILNLTFWDQFKKWKDIYFVD